MRPAIVTLDYWKDSQNRMRAISVLLVLNCWRWLPNSLKLPVLIFTIGIFIDCIILAHKNLRSQDIWRKPYFLYILTCLIFVIPALTVVTEYKFVQNDLLNFFIINLFFLLIISQKPDRDDYRVLISSFFNIHLYFCMTISVVALVKLLLLFNGYQIPFIPHQAFYPWGTNLAADINLYALRILIGLLYLCYKFITTESITYKRFLTYSYLLALNFVYTGSRKSIIFSGLIFIFFILISISPNLLSTATRKRLIQVLVGLSIFIFLFTAINIFLLSDRSLKFKKGLFSAVGISYAGFVRNTLPIFLRHKSILLPTTYNFRTFLMKPAFDIFFTEYSMTGKIFGGGFRYPKIYKKVFNTLDIFYPHSSIISAFLYGGLIGGFVLIALWLQILFHLAKNLPLFFAQLLIFLVSLLFTLTSGNSIFSISMFITVLMLSILGLNF